MRHDERGCHTGQQFADDHEESIEFFKVSAKFDQNVTASFRATFEKLYHEKRLKDGDIQGSEPGLTLADKHPNQPKLYVASPWLYIDYFLAPVSSRALLSF